MNRCILMLLLDTVSNCPVEMGDVLLKTWVQLHLISRFRLRLFSDTWYCFSLLQQMMIPPLIRCMLHIVQKLLKFEHEIYSHDKHAVSFHMWTQNREVLHIWNNDGKSFFLEVYCTIKSFFMHFRENGETQNHARNSFKFFWLYKKLFWLIKVNCKFDRRFTTCLCVWFKYWAYPKGMRTTFVSLNVDL